MNLDKNITWFPEEYAQAAVIAEEAGVELLSRLDVMTIKPAVIIDAGSGTGKFSTKLQSRYPDAQVIAIDYSDRMLQYAKQYENNHAIQYLLADMNALSLPDHSVDLIFANLVLPWQLDINKALQACHRLLRPDGLLMLTAFGPDTLRELGHWQQPESPFMIDMHSMGDLLLQAGFSGPVLDVNYYTLSYKDKQRLLDELYATGMILNKDVVNAVPNAEEKYLATYEIIFAHAFAPALREEYSATKDGVVRIPLEDLKRKLKSE